MIRVQVSVPYGKGTKAEYRVTIYDSRRYTEIPNLVVRQHMTRAEAYEYALALAQDIFELATQANKYYSQETFSQLEAKKREKVKTQAAMACIIGAPMGFRS